MTTSSWVFASFFAFAFPAFGNQKVQSQRIIIRNLPVHAFGALVGLLSLRLGLAFAVGVRLVEEMSDGLKAVEVTYHDDGLDKSEVEETSKVRGCSCHLL
jgi:hypothetical protein